MIKAFLNQLFSIKTAIVSAFETIGIALWKQLLAGAVFALTNDAILAIVVLAVGFILEHVVSYRFKNPGWRIPVLRILGVATLETGTWVGWLALTAIDAVVAAIVLYIGLALGHSLEQNTMRNCPGFFTKLIRGENQDITAIETVGAIGWNIIHNLGPYLPYGLVANIVLFGILQIEHALSNIKARVCYR